MAGAKPHPAADADQLPVLSTAARKARRTLCRSIVLAAAAPKTRNTAPSGAIQRIDDASIAPERQAPRLTASSARHDAMN